MAIDPTRTFKPIAIALLTVSDTRDLATDTSGDILAERIRAAGHRLAERALEVDDAARIASRLNTWIDDRTVDCVITTGGTGLTGRDVTPEALARIVAAGDGSGAAGAREIPGFGELLRRTWCLRARSAPSAPARSSPAPWPSSRAAPTSSPCPAATAQRKTAGTRSSPNNSTAATAPATS